MSDGPRDDLEAKLSLGGRKKVKKPKRAEKPQAEARPVTAPEPPTSDAPVSFAPPAPAPLPEPVPDPVPETAPEPAAEQAQVQAAPQPKKPPKKPANKPKRQRPPRVLTAKSWVPPLLAGLASGMVAVVLYYVLTQGCHWLRGPGGCGGLGLFGVILVLVISGYVGSVLLRLWHQIDPVSTAYLGVGVMAIVVMLTVLRQLDNPVMIGVVPVISALTMMASWWVTNNVVEKADDDWRGGS